MDQTPRAILHVDMDAFYASVEERDDPSLRGKPLVVGGSARRGVVLAASYAARKFGVRSAIPMARALRLCPHLVVVPPSFAKYEEASGQVFALFHELTPLVEGLSLDEAFLDVTRSQQLLGPPRAQAERLRARIREVTRLAASVGIAEVKFAAKIASDLAKPDGLREVAPGTTRAFLAPLPVARLWGVGPRTEEQLRALGLETIGDLSRTPVERLERALGSAGPHLHALACGVDPREVVPDREAKSVGAEETFDEDLDDPEDLHPILHGQALRVAARLRRLGIAARAVSLKVKYTDFHAVTRQETLAAPTDDGGEIYRAALRLLARTPPGPLRLTGVHAQDLGPPGGQLGLFDATDREKQGRLNRSLDAIARKFGAGTVAPADVFGRKTRR
jgi:DNA polymerase-4